VSQEHLQQQRTSCLRNNLYDDVFLQTWTQSCARRYWIVVNRGQSVRATTPDPAIDAHVASVHRRERARLQADESVADFRTSGIQTVECTRPWMERTGWARVYEGVRRDLLRSLTDLPYSTAGSVDLLLGQDDSGGLIISPAADEERLHRLTLAMDCMLDRCEATLSQTSRPILCWLMTTQPSPCRGRPFRFHGRGRSRQDYRRYWKRFLTFVVRAFRMDVQQRQRLTGIRFRREHLALLSRV
jgi:hypothetical protein